MLLFQLRLLRMKYQNTILFTGRSKIKIERILELITVEQPGKFYNRYLTLELPAFIEGDIKEFGECRIWLGEKAKDI